MLILLPPSEGKTAPASGRPLDLDGMDLGTLNPTRERILISLIAVSSGNAKRAMDRLGLGKTQAEVLPRNANLRNEPTARADSVYSGVLYGALDLASLDEIARKRADESVAVASALFGLVRPGDFIPAYRLSGDVMLPRLGSVAGIWRKKLGPVLTELVGDGLLIDLRSGMYVNLHKPTGDLAARTATMRVLHEHNGTRKVVSHFNKATKGRIVRALLTTGANPVTVDELESVLGDLGWTVERHGHRLDVVVSEI
ncbi:MAG: peroxide stress protein YaaA [Actinomycetota bacterium]|nr:peroxide stress protein YaaA [Actinomycetota bacterium]